MSITAFLARKAALAVTATLIGGTAVAGISAMTAAPAASFTLSAASPAPSPAAHHGRSRLSGLRRELLGVFVRNTAQATDQTVKQVRDELRAGKSLNDIAGTKASQVEQKSISDIRTLIEKAVDANKISKEQAAKLVAKLQPLADKIMAAHHQKGQTNRRDSSPAATASAPAA